MNILIGLTTLLLVFIWGGDLLDRLPSTQLDHSTTGDLTAARPLNSAADYNQRSSTKPTTPTFLPQPADFNQVFDHDDSWVATLEAERTTTLMVTGDVLLARAVNDIMSESGNWDWPWEKVSSQLKAADITLINLETPLTAACQSTRTGMIFCGNQLAVQGMVKSGVDVASLANNHALNQGESGVEETAQLLRQHQIEPLGLTDQPLYTTVKNNRLAWLGYTDLGATGSSIASADEQQVIKDISLAKKQADIVVVFFHWGVEYENQPSNRQRHLARTAIDSGADLVLGNHPHWIQSAEWYKNKMIMYSHGNFIFDQMWSLKTRQGVVGRYTFYDQTLIDVVFLPILIEDYGQPHWDLESQSQQQQYLLEISRAWQES